MNKNSLIGLILFLGSPFLFKLLQPGLLIHEVAFWLLLVFIISWIYFVEKRSITSIGWKKITFKTTFAGIGLGILVFILLGVFTTLIRALGLELNQETAQLFVTQPLPVLLLVALRAAVVEEVLYRGYAFERIFDLTKSKWIAGLVSVLFFMLVHLSWGVGHLVFIFFAGGLFMLVYISKRNLPLLMIAHLTTDIITVVVLPLLMAAQ